MSSTAAIKLESVGEYDLVDTRPGVHLWRHRISGLEVQVTTFRRPPLAHERSVPPHQVETFYRASVRFDGYSGPVAGLDRVYDRQEAVRGATRWMLSHPFGYLEEEARAP